MVESVSGRSSLCGMLSGVICMPLTNYWVGCYDVVVIVRQLCLQ